MPTVDTGSSQAGKANVNSDFQLETNLPRDGLLAGFSRFVYRASAALAYAFRGTQQGEAIVTNSEKIYELSFNSAAVLYRGRTHTNATTMTRTAVNGFMRLNGGAITTITTGIAVHSEKVFSLSLGGWQRFHFPVRHVGGSLANKVAEIGIGHYIYVAGQGGLPIEFAGFRWDAAGGLEAVVATSNGVSSVEQTVDINSNVPFSDNVTRNYDMIVTKDRVEFLVDDVSVAIISKTVDALTLFRSGALPIINRLFHSGTPASAPLFDIGQWSVMRGGGTDVDSTTRASVMGKSFLQQQPEIQALNGTAHVFPASGSAAPAVTPVLTLAAIVATALGGLFRINGAAILVGLEANYPVTGFLNPALPPAQASTTVKSFLVRGISISPMIVTTLLAGGGFTVQWYVAVGGTSLTTATVDADGTTALSTKAHRYYPLPRLSTFAAAAILGAIETTNGDFYFPFPTPIPIHPGEILSVGFRTKAVAAAVTSGTIDGSVGIIGDWEV